MHKKDKPEGITFKKLLQSRLLVIALLSLLIVGGILIANRINRDPAAVMSQQLAEQYLKGLEQCDFDKFMRAKSHALYKDSQEIGLARERLQFKEECGKVKMVALLQEKVVKEKDPDQLTSRLYDYKVSHIQGDESGKNSFMRLLVTGNEKDGFLISSTSVLSVQSTKS